MSYRYESAVTTHRLFLSCPATLKHKHKNALWWKVPFKVMWRLFFRQSNATILLPIMSIQSSHDNSSRLCKFFYFILHDYHDQTDYLLYAISHYRCCTCTLRNLCNLIVSDSRYVSWLSSKPLQTRHFRRCQREEGHSFPASIQTKAQRVRNAGQTVLVQHMNMLLYRNSIIGSILALFWVQYQSVCRLQTQTQVRWSLQLGGRCRKATG